jgi:hypothetical protein
MSIRCRFDHFSHSRRATPGAGSPNDTKSEFLDDPGSNISIPAAGDHYGDILVPVQQGQHEELLVPQAIQLLARPL